jgi:hypothetical protein
MNDIRKILESRAEPPRTARELADYLNVPYKTAWGWWSGKRLPKDESVRTRLLQLVQPSPATGAAEVLPFKPASSRRTAKPTPEAGVSRHDLVAQLTRARSLAAELNARLALVGEEVKTSEVDGHQLDALLEKFVAQLYDMSETLTIVVADNGRRQAFRNRVSKEDVAYLTTLLDSLLDEQKFTLWKAFQSFPMKEGKRK